MTEAISKDSKVLVSVCIMAYNHEKYIAQSLDSVLMQKTNFSFEIILGEDESRDKTREICVQYSQKYPDKIKLFLRSRLDVIYINGNPTGRYNFLENIKAAKGSYVALLDGDDYWTDSFKLQKQINFLEANPDFVLCFHEVDVLTNQGIKGDWITKPPVEDTTIVNDLIARGNYIHTCSAVFRNINKKFPSEFFIAPVADYFLYILLTKAGGKIKQLKEKMAVYRYGVGIHSSKNRSKQLWKWNYTLFLLSSDISECRKLLEAKLAESQAVISNDMKHRFLESNELASVYGVKKLFTAIIAAIYKKITSF